eukprot:2491278-Pleurochrysis_carterae.AAC.1
MKGSYGRKNGIPFREPSGLRVSCRPRFRARFARLKPERCSSSVTVERGAQPSKLARSSTSLGKFRTAETQPAFNLASANVCGARRQKRTAVQSLGQAQRAEAALSNKEATSAKGSFTTIFFLNTARSWHSAASFYPAVRLPLPSPLSSDVPPPPSPERRFSPRPSTSGQPSPDPLEQRRVRVVRRERQERELGVEGHRLAAADGGLAPRRLFHRRQQLTVAQHEVRLDAAERQRQERL